MARRDACEADPLRHLYPQVERGLEQDFNSLDAQYAACAAYIANQASEGWTLLAECYDDGGISGGTSLLDFAKLVETASVKLIAAIIQRIKVSPTQIVVTVDLQALGEWLGIDLDDQSRPIEITVAVRLKRSGLAMRLELPTGQAAVCHVDDNLVEAIATAHQWWQRLIDDPKLRISDLARTNNVTRSWAVRILRLSFLDPMIVEQILTGKAPANLTPQVLRSEESIPALWADQRALHRIKATI